MAWLAAALVIGLMALISIYQIATYDPDDPARNYDFVIPGVLLVMLFWGALAGLMLLLT